jgi:hypothetical protein
MNDPERLDLDSVSSGYRRRHCTGSSNLIRALRAAGKLPPELPDPDAESGDRIHRAWCGETIQLDGRETEILDKLRRLEHLVVTDWARGEQCVCLGREQRLWLHERLEPVHSGQFDVAYGTVQLRPERPRILIIDGKTGFKKVAPADTNDQLRELVGLARANFSQCREFSVSILQPFFERTGTTVAVYDEPEAELCLRQLRATIADCADPDAPRIAGAWCDHCPAVTVCVEARASAGRTYDLAKRIEAGELELPIGASGTRLLDAIKAATSAMEAIRKRYKLLLADNPDAAPGWRLKDGKKVRQITDTLAAYTIAKDFMSVDDFFGATKVSITELRDACAKASGSRGRALDDFFNNRFEPVLAWQQHEPELAREPDETRKLKGAGQ